MEDEFGKSTTVGALESGGGFEPELSPFAGAPTPPRSEALPRSLGSNREFRSCMYRLAGGEDREAPQSLQGRIVRSIYPGMACCITETRKVAVEKCVLATSNAAAGR